MKFFKKIFIFILFLLLVICFFPKENLYFYGEKKLSEKKIVIFEEKLTDLGLSFLVKDAKIAYDNLLIGKVQSINFITTLFYNEVKINDLAFSDSIKKFIPQKINNAKIFYSLFIPTKAWINADGDFGEISGDINLYEKKGKLILKPAKNMQGEYKLIMSRFKNIEGEYIYEFSFN